MTKDMPLFYEYESLYRRKYVKEIVRNGLKFTIYEIQLSKDSPEDVKLSYKEYCKELGQRPIYY